MPANHGSSPGGREGGRREGECTGDVGNKVFLMVEIEGNNTPIS